MSADLHTRYLGMELRNPLVLSACPLSEDVDLLQRMEDAGAAAVVFPSLFEEQIEQEQVDIHGMYEYPAESFAEAMSYFPEMHDYNVGPDGYLKCLEEAKKRVSIPIIGSLNGVTPGGWVRYATLIQEAGADALELNIYNIAADPERSASEVENEHLDLVSQVQEAALIPLSVKLTPYFTSLPHFARRLAERGVEGLTLFNRLVHPDIDLEDLQVRSRLEFSTPSEMRLPLMWIALLRGRVDVSLAATSGIHEATQLIKAIMAGADVAMLASSIYMRGPEHFRTLLDDLQSWLEENEYESVEQMKGSLSQQHCPDPTAFERVSYMRTLASFSNEHHLRTAAGIVPEDDAPRPAGA